MPPYVASALSAFRLLVRDYELLLDYVEPDPANSLVFSHRTYELLLRACTEFEALAKGAAIDHRLISEKSKSNIPSLSALLKILNLDSVEVLFLRWTPKPLSCAPLLGWGNTPHALNWYRAYNDVKHNRSGRFSEASLKNVTEALAACFALLLGLRAIKVPLERHAHLPGGRLEIDFPGFQLAIRVNDDWSVIN